MDPEARFRALFTETYPALRRYAHHRGLSAADADDLVAEVFTTAWRRIDDVPLDDPAPWLFAVARNTWRNHHRGERRRTRLIARLGPPAAELPVEPAAERSGDGAPGEPAAERSGDGAPGADAVRAALAALDDADREVIVLVAWDGLSPAQAAIALGCSAGAARVRLHRARRRLAALLDAAQSREEAATRPEEVPDARV